MEENGKGVDTGMKVEAKVPSPLLQRVRSQLPKHSEAIYLEEKQGEEI